MDRSDAERLFHHLAMDQCLTEQPVTNGAGYTNNYVHVRPLVLSTSLTIPSTVLDRSTWSMAR